MNLIMLAKRLLLFRESSVYAKELPPRQKLARIPSLDALRGIAALVVVFHHYRQTIPWLDDSIFLRRLFNGGGAVLIFFVLSGYVLSLSFIWTDCNRYFPFYIKRVTRIWPAFAVTVFMSAVLRLVIGYHYIPSASTAFNDHWQAPLNVASILSHLLMLGNATELNSPMWTLVHEMRISMIFPMLVVLMLMSWRLTLGATILVCIAIGPLQGTSPFASSLLMSVQFSVLFLMGAVLAVYARYIQPKLLELPNFSKSVLWIAAVAGVVFSADFSSAHALSTIGSSCRFVLHGLAATVLVLLCITDVRAVAWLSKRLPMYFGKISYSLYLWHIVVLTAMIQAFDRFFSIPVLTIFAFALTLLVAHLSERFVERPSTSFGRALASLSVSRRNMNF